MMGFLAPLVIGFVAGGWAMWQLDRSQKGAAAGTPVDEAQIDVPDGVGVQVVTPVAVNMASDGSAYKLNAIRGIGPVYAQRLSSAGIRTFTQLAELSPEQLSEILSAGKAENLVNARSWLDQAQQLAKGSTAI